MLDELDARGIVLPDLTVRDYNFRMSGVVGFCDNTTGTINIEFSSDQTITTNEFEADSINNFRSIAASQNSDLVNFFVEFPGDTGIYRTSSALLVPFADVEICDFWLTLRGTVSFTDNSTSGFIVSHEFGIPFDLSSGDDGDIAFALLLLDESFGIQFEEILNLVT